MTRRSRTRRSRRIRDIAAAIAIGLALVATSAIFAGMLASSAMHTIELRKGGR